MNHRRFMLALLLVVCGCAADPGLPPSDAGTADDSAQPVDMQDLGIEDLGGDLVEDLSDVSIDLPDATEDIGPDIAIDMTSCDAGMICSGECVDIQNDIEHCGACDTPCVAPMHASVDSCSEGSCVFVCDSERSDANGDLYDMNSDGCESDCVPDGPEVCDGKDNDCNGTADDGIVGPACSTGLEGICEAGTDTCVSGAFQCVQNEMARAEVCNGVDDNCDGSSDEGCPDSVSLSNFRASPQYGGTGGTIFQTQCPIGMVLSGINGRTDQKVDRVQGRCRGLEFVEDSSVDPFEYRAEASGTGLNLPSQGGTGGTATSAFCPSGEMVIGIFGRSGSDLDQLQVKCGIVNIEDTGSGFMVRRVATIDRNLGGGNGGAAFTYTCPGESVVTGIFGRDSSVIDAIGVQCADVGFTTR